MMSTKLNVGNLPAGATEADLESKFAQFGTVESVTLLTDIQTGRSKRSGLVVMGSETEARAAINRLNMTQYDETIMSVSASLSGGET
jgi:RNA recognition motif-containing protein